MESSNEERDKLLYERVTSHHEHSDENYIKYFNSMIAVNTAIIAGISLLTFDYIKQNSKSEIVLITLLSIFGIYICSIYNTYMLNEKIYQDYLIDYYDKYRNSKIIFSNLEPIPFGAHKRKITDPERDDVERKKRDRGWSQFPKFGMTIYVFIALFCSIFVFTS